LIRRPRAVVCEKCVGVSRLYFAQKCTTDRHEYWKSRQPTLDLSRIDIEASKFTFGYSTLDVNTRSSKKVIAACEFCGESFKTSLASLYKNQKHVCCHRCSHIAARFGPQSIDKRKFHDEYITKQNIKLERIPFPISSPGSDAKVTAACDFCQKSIIKQIKYINYKHGQIICSKCSGIASAFNKQGEIKDKHEFWLSRHPKIDWSLVDINETISQFGHDPRDLSAGSNKKLIVKCCFCQNLTSVSFHYWIKNDFKKSCKSCKHKKNVETIIHRYGVSSVLEIPGVKDKANNPITEQIVEASLRERYKVEYIRNYEIPITDERVYSFDFFIPSCGLLIECQGDYFHNFKQNGYSGTPKDRAKSSFIENNTNFKLVHIWEHEIHIGRMNKILDFHIHKLTEPTFEVKKLKDLTFGRIPTTDAHVFLSQYHYLGNLGIIATCYGAFHNETLISVCAFGGTTRQNTLNKVKTLIDVPLKSKQLRELRRFCIRPNIIARRLASFVVRSFVDIYHKEFPDTKVIISFSDPTVGDIGSIYKYSGWNKLSDTSKSYHYMDPTTYRMIHKKTIWNLATAAHMTECEFVSNSSLVKVNELPKSMWAKILT
jgi:hypothetical protein